MGKAHCGGSLTRSRSSTSEAFRGAPKPTDRAPRPCRAAWALISEKSDRPRSSPFWPGSRPLSVRRGLRAGRRSPRSAAAEASTESPLGSWERPAPGWCPLYISQRGRGSTSGTICFLRRAVVISGSSARSLNRFQGPDQVAAELGEVDSRDAAQLLLVDAKLSENSFDLDDAGS